MTNEYTKKYNQELTELSNVDLNYSSILSYIQAFYTKIDNEINNGQDTSWIFLGHYIVMIVDCTNLLKKCYDERNYRVFSTFKELEAFLNKNRDAMDLQSYKVLRKKISFIKGGPQNY